MKTQPKNSIATKALYACLVVLCAGPALAATTGTAVGTVTQVNGPLLLQRADGSVKAIALNSFVEQGDTLVTEKNTYAQLKFADDSEITLKPGTQLKIEVLAFNATAASNMDTVFSLARGAVQITTGAAARAQPENIKLVIPSLLNPSATAVVNRKAGTTFVAQYVAGSAPSQLAMRYPGVQLAWADTGYRTDAPRFSVPTQWDAAAMLLAQNTANPGAGGGLAPGLYVHVIDGLIQLSNRGGVQQFAAGQFGFTGSVVQPPVIVPNNPGIQFNPPPAFQSSTAPKTGSTSSKPKTVDCEVR